MKSIFDEISKFKAVIALFLAVLSSAVWGFDYTHKIFIKKTELSQWFKNRDIQSHQVEITRLEVRMGMSEDPLKINEFETMIAIEKIQILRLGGNASEKFILTSN